MGANIGTRFEPLQFSATWAGFGGFLGDLRETRSISKGILWICMEIRIFYKGEVPFGFFYENACISKGASSAFASTYVCLTRGYPEDLHENMCISNGGFLWICMEDAYFKRGCP